MDTPTFGHAVLAATTEVLLSLPFSKKTKRCYVYNYFLTKSIRNCDIFNSFNAVTGFIITYCNNILVKTRIMLGLTLKRSAI